MKKLISAMFFAVLAATAAMADALDTTLFAKKSDITVSGYAGSTPLANFPVLVRLEANSPSGFDYADCAADGSDLRFADANGDLIPHEIDTWKTDGTSLVWVSVPSVSGTATAFTMYYGAANPSALPAVDPHAVWTAAGHRAVWHFAADATESAQGLVASTATGTPSYENDGAVGKCWQSAGEVTYAVDGNTLQIAVPRAMLGIGECDSFTLNFKWSDNMQNDGDIMDFYENGDVAPEGRYKYQLSVINAPVPSGETEPAQTSDGAENPSGKGGKGAVIAAAAGAAIAAGAAAAAVIIKKKHE